MESDKSEEETNEVRITSDKTDFRHYTFVRRESLNEDVDASPPVVADKEDEDTWFQAVSSVGLVAVCLTILVIVVAVIIPFTDKTTVSLQLHPPYPNLSEFRKSAPVCARQNLKLAADLLCTGRTCFSMGNLWDLLERYSNISEVAVSTFVQSPQGIVIPCAAVIKINGTGRYFNMLTLVNQSTSSKFRVKSHIPMIENDEQETLVPEWIKISYCRKNTFYSENETITDTLTIAMIKQALFFLS